MIAPYPNPDGTFGIFDEDQASRVLSSPQNRIMLASKSHTGPNTASQPYPDRTQENSDRILVELTPLGAFWRSIPKPLSEGDALLDENWPRLVDVCGLVPRSLIAHAGADILQYNRSLLPRTMGHILPGPIICVHSIFYTTNGYGQALLIPSSFLA